MGKGNYIGSKTIEFDISETHLLFTTIDYTEGYTYTGSPIVQGVAVTYNGMTLVEGVDYTVSCTDNISAGKAHIVITGIGNYCGSISTYYMIAAKAVSGVSVSSVADQKYTGSAISPAVTVKDGTKTLTKDTDYTVSYANNTNAGTATITITGKGNYTGTKTATFKITGKNASGLTVSAIADQTYTGSAIKPTVTVKDGSKTLTSGTHYTVSYSNNVNVGTATVTITGKGNYTETKTATFKIVARSASELTISSVADQTYTGSAITPAVTVKDGTKTLTSGTDYTVSYSNNVNVGTATVTITGKGNYTEIAIGSFNIVGKNAANFTVSAIADQTYTGSAIKPAVTVKDGTKTLTKGTDYTVSYTNNTNVGTATVTITGKGNYTGTKKLTFKIVNPIGHPKVTAKGGKKQITLTWKSVPDAEKYGVYRYADGKYTRIDIEVPGTIYVVTGLEDDTEYTFFVQAYVNGKWSSAHEESYATAKTDEGLPYPIVTAKGGNKSVTLTWTKVSGATKYGVYRFTNSKYTKIDLEVTGTTYTVTGLEEDTEYTFFVQAYKDKWLAGGSESYVIAKTNPGLAYPIVTAKGGLQSVTLEWSKVKGAEKYGVYKYAGGKYTKIDLAVTGTSYTITGLDDDTEYTFFVQAYKDGKWITGADESYASAKTDIGLSYPIVTAKCDMQSVSLSWTKVSGATKYAVYKFENNKYVKLNNEVTGTTYTVTGLEEDIEYTFFVQAYKDKWLAGGRELRHRENKPRTCLPGSQSRGRRQIRNAYMEQGHGRYKVRRLHLQCFYKEVYKAQCRCNRHNIHCHGT